MQVKITPSDISLLTSEWSGVVFHHIRYAIKVTGKTTITIRQERNKFPTIDHSKGWAYTPDDVLSLSAAWLDMMVIYERWSSQLEWDGNEYEEVQEQEGE